MWSLRKRGRPVTWRGSVRDGEGARSGQVDEKTGRKDCMPFFSTCVLLDGLGCWLTSTAARHTVIKLNG